jgi:iron complex transport system ATP-binding protein
MTVLRLQDARVTLDGRDIIQNVTCQAGPGEMVGLLGPNGAGKTTTVRALLGLQKLSSGSASIDGIAIAALSFRARAQKLAYLPQARQMAWPIIVREAVALGRFAYGTSYGKLGSDDQIAIDQAIHDCDLEALANRSVASLSGGELARVHIARAFASTAPAIIADEPTSALDPSHAFGVLELLQTKARQGGVVVVILHDLALAARFCSKIILLNQGKIVASGAPKDALTIENITEIYKMRATWDETNLSIIGRV